MRAIALLSWWQLRNAIRTTLTEPRKLIPFVVIVGIIFFQMFIYVSMGPREQAPPDFLPNLLEFHGPAVHAIVFLALVLGAAGFLEMGFSGGALTFNLADIDFLFPSPIPRRVVLAYRLPAIIWRYLMQAGIFLYLGYVFLWRHVQAEGLPSGTGAVLFLALAFWMIGYGNIAVTLEIVFGRGRIRTARWAVIGGLAILASWVAFVVWRGGFDGVAAVERNPVMQVLFFPCRLLADAVVAPLGGQRPLWSVLGLFAFCLAALALALSRRENFYEAALPHSERMARIRQAVRQGNVGAVLVEQVRERAARRLDRRGAKARPARDYLIPAFGRGAVAVLWANLNAAAKRPLANFYGPLLSGLGVTVAALVWARPVAPLLALAATGYAAYMVMIVGSRIAFRQAVDRQSLVRPLPLSAWKIVLAEALPVVLSASLFGWGAAAPILVAPAFLGMPGDPLAAKTWGYAGLVVAALVFGVPVALSDMCLLQYAVMMWYPAAQDKLQQLIGGVVGLLLFSVLAIALAPFALVPLALGAPLGVTLISLIIGGLLASLVLTLVAARAFRTAPPLVSTA